ncbi:hypothetical protein GobsT_59420 [Gemmata obscuriglobus]|uniref:DUF4058 domain-containing protein n=1 Tax=Gemmata obscuriglobus TaxID=114 RepID=A0A2Z3H3S6_9BACT|nr:DUF4058 family protein [Gemmata obscuriglobus]AWM36274.1 DUF4058 domain-containing protein [Gemmata obscuriglobus]QEG31121.1 hypothetical protein GobsT_59420 [Gemmata obscuriglobus]VTS10458.1 Uncharacterized protein OS=Candidatus Entotheonella sp. TSY2 GN=ETSY2_35130 PE=4 SV=1: DUF4058 [Gemmata obscuriglobus UQM 2246]
MPSPFPGMDPWLERPMVFPDVHHGLITYLKAAIFAALPPGYTVSTSNRVWVDIEPDVIVVGPDPAPGDGAHLAATMSAAGLLAIKADEVLSDPIEEPYLAIVSGEGDRLVTAVEVLSLANKRAEDRGRTSYRHKQNEYRLSNVNVVEIDLLRGGPHTTAVPLPRLRAVAPNCDYHISVMVAGSPRHYFVAPITLADRLPHVPIPLDSGVEPVTIDLQAVFDRCYDEGGFARRVKYAKQQPEPSLTREQQAWAEDLLRTKGLLP